MKKTYNFWNLIFKYIEDNGLNGTVGIRKSYFLNSGIPEYALNEFLAENNIQVDGEIIIINESKLRNKEG